MNERQCVPAPESLLIGCMQTYLWRDERSGRCYFRLETRQEMPMKEMIRDSYVKNNLDNKEIRWNVINCDATQAGISFFKERTPIKVYGYFSLDSMPDGVAYDFIVTRVEETDAEEMTILEYLITFPGINFSDAVVIVKNHGTDMFRMVHQPGIVNRLVAETRLPSNVISNLCKSIASTTEERKVFELLHDCGVSYAACAKAVKLYGSSVEEKIMEDPASASCENQSFSPDLILYAARACKMNYGEQQRSAFPMVLRKKGVKILTGGPGTGKTTTILGILLAYKRMHPKDTIRLCAPTGRAAQRMAESTHMEAVTVHRLLDLKPYGDTTVCKDSSDPIDADLIVVDEMSMINIEVFDLLLEAIKTGTTLVLVGDINQLESVGAGAVLHDLLEAPESLIPRTMLTDVFRQKGDSSIISNAIRINAGITTLDERPDFQVIHTKSAEESLEQVKSLMKKLYNPEEPFSTQILCPARKGISGVENMNIALQALLNPQTKGITYGSIKYRLNDKVMFYKNNYSISSYEGEIGLYNGDIGKIVKVSESGLTVNVRNSHYEITRDLMDNLGLSYAMTIHKSQGSEFSCIIVVMPAEPTNMLVRNLFYTAVTRAKKKVYVIDESYAMETSIRIAKAGKRLTNLAEYLKSE